MTQSHEWGLSQKIKSNGNLSCLFYFMPRLLHFFDPTVLSLLARQWELDLHPLSDSSSLFPALLIVGSGKTTMARPKLLVLAMAVLGVAAAFFDWSEQLVPIIRSRRKVSIEKKVVASVVDVVMSQPSHSYSVPLAVGANGSGSLSADVDAISHFPAETKIIIDLKEQRNCTRPLFIGRLSGPYLATIVWETSSSSLLVRSDEETSRNLTSSNQIVGHYNVPAPGRYFLEIIGILCNDFNFDTDIEKVCLVDPEQHRITHDLAFINVTHHSTPQIEDDRTILGYWEHNKNTTTKTPLFTRYQPQNCREMNSTLVRHCVGAMSRERFAPYQFVWNDGIDGRDEQQPPSLGLIADEQFTSSRSLSSSTIKLCLVGASHARALKFHIRDYWFQRWNVSNSSIGVHHVFAQYPTDISPSFIQERIIKPYNCSKVIVGLGQWSAGWPTGKPTLFPVYKEQMTNAIKHFQNAGLLTTTTTHQQHQQLYLRSIHYNPLGDDISSCPARDWRSPATIDGYNDIIQILCAESTLR